MSITIAIIVGRYGERSPLERCPRVGCRSAKTTANEAGDKIRSVCRTRFNIAQKPLPRRNRQALDVYYKRLRNEWRHFKNIHIHFTVLPETPTVPNVRTVNKTSGKMKRKRDTIHDQTPQKKQRLSSDRPIEYRDPYFSFGISSSGSFESLTAAAQLAQNWEYRTILEQTHSSTATYFDSGLEWPHIALVPNPHPRLVFHPTMDAVGIVRVPEAVQQKLPDEWEFGFPNGEQQPVLIDQPIGWST
ncbi:hypothetical protein VTN00DRAFT_6829 [Thermoascus crustaceus]|uniref:uncharacterized protein n=1 Tax=Thermoascus crustaceus TaxID=5088 RepID=UPI0037425958